MTKIPWNKGKKNIYSDETLKKWSEKRKGKTHSEQHKANLSAARKIINEKKRVEIWLRKCNVDSTHQPYIHKSTGNPTWFKDKTDPIKYVCGKCHSRQIAKPKYHTTEQRRKAQSEFMKSHNPMKNESSRKKISITKTGVRLGNVHSLEFKEKQKKRFTENNPSKNGISKEQRSKISKTRLHRFQTGQIKPSVQKKGEDNPRYGIERPEHVRKAISRSNVGKVVSEETKAKIRLKRLFQNNFGQSGSLDERKMALILEEFQVPYITHAPLKGFPDFLILPNLIIMVDGDYEHANPSPYRTSEYHDKMHDGYKEDDLIRRITAGEKRSSDKKITENLKQQGFVVKRFWGSEIKYETKNVMLQLIEELGKLNI